MNQLKQDVGKDKDEWWKSSMRESACKNGERERQSIKGLVYTVGRLYEKKTQRPACYVLRVNIRMKSAWLCCGHPRKEPYYIYMVYMYSTHITHTPFTLHATSCGLPVALYYGCVCICICIIIIII